MSAYQIGVSCAQQRKPVWWVRERTRMVPRQTARAVWKGYVSYRRVADVHVR